MLKNITRFCKTLLMVFTSYIFLFLFLPLFNLLYNLKKNLRYKNIILLISSLIFYYYDEKNLVLIMIFSGTVDFVLGWFIGLEYNKERPSKNKTTTFLIISLVLNLGLLIYFKYSGFLLELTQSFLSFFEVDSLNYNLKVVLPLGISFYTFQSMSYTIDVYRRETKYQKNYVDFMAYISMFPQLVAGPIVRYSEVAKQLSKREVTPDNTEIGVKRFIRGICKKVLIANPMGLVADNIFNLDFTYLDSSTAWLGAIAYTMQIFFDFSAYSDMAIGIGRVFRFIFPENFNYPYVSKSIQEFWRRWHMSLSRWFRDYLYIPLGGNKSGKLRTYFNLSLVFLICGFWHGPSWNFIIWGAYHGLFLVLERISPFKKYKIASFLKHIYVLIVVIVGWVFFRADTLSDAQKYLYSMFDLSSGIDLSFFINPSFTIPFSLAVIFSLDRQYRLKVIGNKMDNKKISTLIYMIGLFMSILLIAGDSYNPFIYFRF